jgi:enoyl-CoA hydratase/carnithine racemase
VSEAPVLVETRNGVATVTLNRPDARNALNPPLLLGAGNKAFCAGADLKGVGDRGTSRQARESFSGLPRILEAMARMRTPLVAQVYGFALAGGGGLAVGCDVVVVADDAVFGLPEIKLGLLPLIVMAPILRAAGRKREYAAALRYLRELTTLVFLSDDAREGVTAFFEKRAPRWTGH